MIKIFDRRKSDSSTNEAQINDFTKNESQTNEPSVNEAEINKLPINDESSKNEALIKNQNGQETKIVEKPLVNEETTISKERPIKLPFKRLDKKEKICSGCCQIL